MLPVFILANSVVSFLSKFLVLENGITSLKIQVDHKLFSDNTIASREFEPPIGLLNITISKTYQ